MFDEVYTQEERELAVADLEKQIDNLDLDEIYDEDAEEDLESDKYFDSLPDDYEFDLEDDGLDESDYMYY